MIKSLLPEGRQVSKIKMAMVKTSILILEDEISIRDMIRLALELANFNVSEATNTIEADHIIAGFIPDLILLDWMLPGISGVDWIKRLKRNEFTQNIPIIMLTAKAEEYNKIKGLEYGADDYITKPFSPRELIARIRTVLRRGLITTMPDATIEISGIRIDSNTSKVSIENQAVNFPPREFQLLYFLMKNPNRIHTRSQLLTNVWKNNLEIDERTVDVEIRRIRSVLKQFNLSNLIETSRGNGYLFVKKQ